LAIGRGATCSGCDIAVLDIDEKLLDVLEVVDIVYAPTIMDFKYSDLEAMEDKSIDVGLYHGAVRDSENEHLAKTMRQKCKILISFGSCACFGGIPGLANVTNKKEIFKEVYDETATTVNPEFVTPQSSMNYQGYDLTLPEFYNEVFSLDDKVDVDYFMPACPPTPELIMMALTAVIKNELPPKGGVIASEKTLCDECKRKHDGKRKITKIVRPHEVLIDDEMCLLDQGILCLGPATRGGCEAQCLQVNMPCRGCMGPTKSVVDHGGSILSALTSIMGEENAEKMISEVKDPLGTFYRFTLPKSLLRKKIEGGD